MTWHYYSLAEVFNVVETELAKIYMIRISFMSWLYVKAWPAGETVVAFEVLIGSKLERISVIYNEFHEVTCEGLQVTWRYYNLAEAFEVVIEPN